MPNKTVMELSNSCKIITVEWEIPEICNTIELEFTDQYHSGNETTIDIEKEQAIAMIAMFQKHFNI